MQQDKSNAGPSSITSNSQAYKTLLCHQWLANGSCARGNDCNFAHGTNELRGRSQQEALLYKSEICKFWLSGRCAHGEQCNYAHGQMELKVPMSTLKATAEKFVPDDPSSSAASTKAAVFVGSPPYSTPPPPMVPTASGPYFVVPSMPAPPPFPHPQPFLPPPPAFLPQAAPLPPKAHDGLTFYQMSNPPPLPQPPPSLPPTQKPLRSAASATSTSTTMLWGQPPSLNTLLQPSHFQPLTRPGVGGVPGGGGAVVQAVPSIGSSPLWMRQQKQPMVSPTVACAPSSQPQLFHRREFSSFQPPGSLAEIALKLNSMKLTEPPPAPPPPPKKFDANDENDFPSLVASGSNSAAMQKTTKQQPPAVSALSAAEQQNSKSEKTLSFAKMAAKRPAAFTSNMASIISDSNNKAGAKTQKDSRKPAQQPVVAPAAIDMTNRDQQQHQYQAPWFNKTVTRPPPPADNREQSPATTLHSPLALQPPIMQTSTTSSASMDMDNHCSSSSPSLSASSSSQQVIAATTHEQPFVSDEPPATSLLDDIFNKDPFLNHLEALKAELNKTIDDTGRRGCEFVPPNIQEVVEEVEVEEEKQWHTVVRGRTRHTSTIELPHQSSPFSDDGYQEDFAWSEADGSRSNTPSSINQGQLTNAASASHSGLTKENPFWKTQICRYWRLWRDGKGVPCKHGRGCFFAHGEKDLQKLDPYYYKTQLCEYWNQEEPCPYKDSCNFAHGEGQLRRVDTKGPKSKPGLPNRLFFNRHRVRKPRGKQTIQPFHSYCIGTNFEKVTVTQQQHQTDGTNKK